jgi:glutamate dehydrogenase
VATEAYFLIADELEISELLAAVNALPRDDRWRTMARATLREDLFTAQAALTLEVLSAGDGPVDKRFEAWREATGPVVERTGRVISEILAAGHLDLAMASVALRNFRALITGPRA